MLLRFHFNNFEIPDLKLYFGTVNVSWVYIDQVMLFFPFLICSALSKKQSVYKGTTRNVDYFFLHAPSIVKVTMNLDTVN